MQAQDGMALVRCREIRGRCAAYFVREYNLSRLPESPSFSQLQAVEPNPKWAGWYYMCQICRQFVNELEQKVVTTDKQGRMYCAECYGKVMNRPTEAQPTIKSTPIPIEYAMAGLDDFSKRISRERLALLKNWPDKLERPQLCICGPRNSGKTRAAWAVIRHSNKVVQYKNCISEQHQWARGFTGIRESIVTSWFNSPFLVLENLTETSPEDGWCEMVARVLNRRLWVKQRPTIITASLVPENIRERFGSDWAKALSACEWIVLGAREAPKAAEQAPATVPPAVVKKPAAAPVNTKELFG